MMNKGCPFTVFLTLCVLPLFPAYASANSLGLKVGLGKVSVNKSSPVASLKADGYTVNSFSRDEVDKNSNSVGIAYSFTPRLNLELTLQDLGKIKSTLDLELPANKTSQQAAEDVVNASSQQTGGLYLAVGANYIHPVSSKVDLRAGIGVLAGKNDHQVTINDEDVDVSNNVYAPFFKLGSGLDITQKLSITAHVERYFLDEPVNRYEIGLTYNLK